MKPWPKALPAIAWNTWLLSGFERSAGPAMDLWDLNRTPWIEALTAAHSELGLAELSRLMTCLEREQPELVKECGAQTCAAYGLRWCDQLSSVMKCLVTTPMEFQNWVDEKKLGARDLACLLALSGPLNSECVPFFRALPRLRLSKTQAVVALELFVELLLMGRPLSDLLPHEENGSDSEAIAYLRRLERWRKPMAASREESWRETVAQWPWPAHVQGHWQRFGDLCGLEVKIRVTSPDEFQQKLDRLQQIRDTWSCQS